MRESFQESRFHQPVWSSQKPNESWDSWMGSLESVGSLGGVSDNPDEWKVSLNPVEVRETHIPSHSKGNRSPPKVSVTEVCHYGEWDVYLRWTQRGISGSRLTIGEENSK